MPRTLRLAPIMAVIAIAAAGCGGSKATATKASLVAQADPICKQISVARSAANAALTKATTATSKLQILAKRAPAVAVEEQQAVVRLRALKAPTALAADWQQLLAGMQQLAQDTTQIATDAKANNLKSIETLTSSGRKVREKLTALANRFGFVYCGRTS